MIIDDEQPKTPEEIEARVQAMISIGYPEPVARKLVTGPRPAFTLPGGLLPM